MNTEINHQIAVGHRASGQGSASLVTFWLASARTFVASLGPRSRGFIMLLALVLVAIPSMMLLFPSKVTPATAPLEVFSAERAMRHLPVIAAEPHPQGSPAQARVRDYLVAQLAGMGLEVQVQRTGGLENVVARLRGTDPTGTIVVLSHYDTVSYSPGAGDNGSAVAALVEIMRALAAGPAPRNDVIVLFDDCEEIGPFAGTKAFVREHPWMKDVAVAISLDTAVAGFISTNEVGPTNNGWLVHALARAYTGGAWMSFSGGGQYNSTPFRQAGIPVLALEDNYPFRQKHTEEDVPDIISPATVQQMGDQTLAITRVLGALDLVNPRGEQETFFSVPLLGFIHYPQAWSLPLAIASAILLVLAVGLALWRRFASWRGLAVALGAILVTAAASVLGVGALQPRLPRLFGWKTYLWQEWPEVIPPNGWLAAALFGLLVLALAVGVYLFARRWSARTDFSLMGLMPFAIAAVVLAVAEPRTAYAFTWPVWIAALVWIVAAFARKTPTKWSLDLAAMLAAAPLVMMFLPFLPGIIMSDGMKSLNILAGIEALLLSVVLPGIDSLLVRQSQRR